ncbi:MAG TPA: hypothetical protein VFD02_07695 [Syntrophomonadaceae bacterium]|nr:hypothetical protein [Syntrophomonadaceae bacterium]
MEKLKSNYVKYPAIPARKKTGKESFINGDTILPRKLQDFWSWAFSDLIGNTERGKLAEYIVAMALGSEDDISCSWESFDLKTSDNKKIEVKASAYLQSWEQDKLSQIRFNVRPTIAWDKIANKYDDTARRQSDVYVFCLLKHKEQETLNPLDLAQWEFYTLSTAKLNEIGGQKTISLSYIINLGATKSDFNNLSNAIYYHLYLV